MSRVPPRSKKPSPGPGSTVWEPMVETSRLLGSRDHEISSSTSSSQSPSPDSSDLRSGGAWRMARAETTLLRSSSRGEMTSRLGIGPRLRSAKSAQVLGNVSPGPPAPGLGPMFCFCTITPWAPMLQPVAVVHGRARARVRASETGPPESISTLGPTSLDCATRWQAWPRGCTTMQAQISDLICDPFLAQEHASYRPACLLSRDNFVGFASETPPTTVPGWQGPSSDPCTVS